MLYFSSTYSLSIHYDRCPDQNFALVCASDFTAILNKIRFSEVVKAASVRLCTVIVLDILSKHALLSDELDLHVLIYSNENISHFVSAVMNLL